MVFNCDCIEYMRSLPDKFFNLAIADPPYGAANSDMDCRGGRFGERFKRYFQQTDSVEALGQTDTRFQPCPRREVRKVRNMRGGGRNTTMGCRAAKGIFRPAFQSV